MLLLTLLLRGLGLRRLGLCGLFGRGLCGVGELFEGLLAALRGGGGLAEFIALLVGQVLCLLDRALERFRILRQLCVEPRLLQRVLHGLLLLGESLERLGHVGQRCLQRGHLRLGHFARLEFFRQLAELLLRPREVAFGEILGELCGFAVALLEFVEVALERIVHACALAFAHFVKALLHLAHALDRLAPFFAGIGIATNFRVCVGGHALQRIAHLLRKRLRTFELLLHALDGVLRQLLWRQCNRNRLVFLDRPSVGGKEDLRGDGERDQRG